MQVLVIQMTIKPSGSNRVTSTGSRHLMRGKMSWERSEHRHSGRRWTRIHTYLAKLPLKTSTTSLSTPKKRRRRSPGIWLACLHPAKNHTSLEETLSNDWTKTWWSWTRNSWRRGENWTRINHASFCTRSNWRHNARKRLKNWKIWNDKWSYNNCSSRSTRGRRLKNDGRAWKSGQRTYESKIFLSRNRFKMKS